ncbi:PQQ-binding-like beta-propeller repeat protein [Ulvibacterium sp.]|uniref:PQQ-binding-like beta-propeller repeat protein n=1 Tax=Ulvibacterium sp. TaxID=2665914 RepID=UPI0026389BE5|nr:PQQ-binding-like beta-propeller repeat protein [Ulvibacterium sp.]
MIRINLVAFILLISFASIAQQKIALENKVTESILNSSTGIVLVKTSESVFGIGPEKRAVIWENKAIGKLDFDRYTEIPFTPYVFFEDKPLINSKILSKALNLKGTSRAIVDVTNGKIVFNSREQGFQAVFNTLPLLEQGAVLVDGKTEEGFGIGLFDFKTGKKIWKTQVVSDFFTRTKGALLNEEKVLLDANQDIFWLRNRQLLKIDSKTGQITYDKKGVTSILLNEKGNRLYISSNNINSKRLNQETVIYALNPINMDSLWSGPPVRIVGNVIEKNLDGNQLVVITSKGFDIVNTQNGKKKWDKSDPLPLIKKIVPTKNGYLVVQENLLTRVDNLGRKAWDEPIKITYTDTENPVHIFDYDTSALFITPSRANRIEIESGRKIWEEDLALFDADFINRNLKLEIPFHRVWSNPKNGQFPVYSENNFYLFNNKDRKAPQSLQSFDFGREFPKLKIRSKAYFLYLGNQFYLFDFSGKLVYKKEYPSVKSGSFVRRSFRDSFYWLKRGLQITSATLLFAPTQANRAFRSTIVSNDLGVLGRGASGIYGTYRSYTQGIDGLTDFDLDLDSNLEYVFKRIRKSRNNNDAMIITIPDNDEIRIINFQIDTGKEELIKKIDGGRGTFIIDEIERMLYFFEGKEVSIEKL